MINIQASMLPPGVNQQLKETSSKADKMISGSFHRSSLKKARFQMKSFCRISIIIKELKRKGTLLKVEIKRPRSAWELEMPEAEI